MPVRDARAPADPSVRIWAALSADALPFGAAVDWVSSPRCGGVVTFTGAVRDHAEGRPDVTELEYEAYEAYVEPRLDAVARDALDRWPAVERIALLHRVGTLAVGDAAVVVAVGAPHRGDAFDAARSCIDTLKSTVPIWKRERWRDGESWGLDASPVIAASADASRSVVQAAQARAGAASRENRMAKPAREGAAAEGKAE